MLVEALFIVCACLYGAAAAMHLLYVAQGRDGLVRPIHATTGIAVATHAAFLVTSWQTLGHAPAVDIQSALALAAFLTEIAYVIALLRFPVAMLGAFITPITLLLFLGSAFGRGVTDVSGEVVQGMLWLHIGVNVLGITAFAVAAGAGAAYVVQERLLRQKRIDGAFRRLPNLNALDRVSGVALGFGFPAYTLGLVTGAFAVLGSASAGAGFSNAQLLGVLTWLVFAAVIGLRMGAGWQGRRAALGTLVGFICMLSVLAGYAIGGANGGAGV